MAEINARFIARAYVGNVLADMSHYHLVLQQAIPGTCVLTIKGQAVKHAIVSLELGWGESISREFLGFIDRVLPSDNGYSMLFCRELTAALVHPIPINLRHPTMRQVLRELASITGLTFAIPDASYTDTAIPCFYADSSGIATLDNVGRAFQIPDFIWQQQGDGRVYVGSYADSDWQGRQVTIPDNLLTEQRNGRSARIMVTPKLRPNVTANGQRIQSVEIKDTTMEISW